jgi:hypothetical protein
MEIGVKRSIWIGRDRREEVAFNVTRQSLLAHLSETIPVHALELGELKNRGLYNRPTEEKNGRLIDVRSRRQDYDGSMSTDHAIGRFYVPHLAGSGWALFMDGDMLVRDDLAPVFDHLDPKKAIYCVQHDHRPNAKTKMDGQVQAQYPRKNWSSFMIFNCDHAANKALTPELIDTIAGRDLHRFCWLSEEEIGGLDSMWNWLVGYSQPKVLHFTGGTPDMPGYENAPYADEWRAVATQAQAAA